MTSFILTEMSNSFENLSNYFLCLSKVPPYVPVILYFRQITLNTLTINQGTCIYTIQKLVYYFKANWRFKLCTIVFVCPVSFFF